MPQTRRKVVRPDKNRPASSRDEVVERLRAHEAEIRRFHATALYLFGSAARDEMKRGSDVDVFIDYESGGRFTFVEWVRLSKFLRDILGRKVDFMTRASLNARLRSSIEQDVLRVF